MSTVAPTSTINALSEIIEQDLSGSVPASTPGLDSFYKRLATTSIGVTSAGIGQDFKVLHPFRQGVAGTIKWVSTPLGPAPYNASGTGLNEVIYRGASNVSAYPGLAENAAPGHLTQTISLARARGNIFLPIEYMKADVLDATIVSSVKEIIQAAAENIMLAEIHQFYRITSGSGNVQGIATVAKTPTFSNFAGTNDKATVTIATGSIRNFQPGMFIDFHDPTSGNRINTNLLVIDQVRYIPDTTNDSGGWGQIVLIDTTGATLSATQMDTSDVIVRRDSKGNGPLGPEDWLKTSGTVFGVNLATHMQFQSIVQAVSGVLTEPVLNQLFGRFFQSYGMSMLPDSIVTSIGVTNAHIEQSDGLSQIQRNGQRFVVADGFDMGDVPYRFAGRNVSWDSSAYMPSSSDMTATAKTGGRLWALKTRDQNLVRYVPPRRAFAGQGDQPFDREVEFVASSTAGPMGIFKFRHDTSGDTVNFLEAPFDKWVALAPHVIQGILATGLTESI